MIYKNSYFGKELRQAYIENRIGTKRKSAFAFFLGLIAFAIHFMLQTMTETVLSESVPHLMQQSFFSTVHTYIAVAFFLYVFYFILYYDYLSFAELRKNRWYLLVKMGYKPLWMILSKIIASLTSIAGIYTVGFVLILVFTVFLKYSFVYSYLPALYLAGLADLVVITVIAMTASLYIQNSTNARYFVFFSAFFLMFLKLVLGFQNLLTDRAQMQNLLTLFDSAKSLYFPVAGEIVLVCLIVCVLRAESVAKYYRVPYDMYGYVLPEGEEVVRLDEKRGRVVRLLDTDAADLRSKVLDISATTFLILFICAALVFNVFIILISSAQPGKEVTIRGVIPYIFKSDTMEPAIMENDLAYFRHIGPGEGVKIGDIVLFQDQKVVYVERVVEKDNDRLIVDIDYYPPMSEVGAMRKAIYSSSVYGVYTHANRWIGALILFANTLFGRLAFLLGPAFLLFFYQPVKNFFVRSIRQYMDEEQ